MKAKLIEKRQGRRGITLILAVKTGLGICRRRVFLSQERMIDFTDLTLERFFSDEEYQMLVEDIDAKEALERASSILAIADQSERALREKLLAKGFTPQAIDLAIKELLLKGYLCEERQLSRFLELASKKGKGMKKLYRMFLSRGYTREKINQAIQKASESGVYRESEVFLRLCQSKLPCDATEEEKETLAVRYGFSPKCF